jgi:DNA-binding NarL/FixJ family response regulator
MSTKPTEVFIVDDHPMVRERLAELVGREEDLVVCGESGARADAFERILKLRPDLVLVDLSLDNSQGLDLIKDLHAAAPEVIILVVSMRDELIYAERCLRAGARGYITKQEASRSVMHAIRTVLSGEISVSEAVAKQLVSRAVGRKEPRISGPLPMLSDRELQVFELIGRGCSTREIGSALGIDGKTIDTYRSRIREKLQLKHSSELLPHAIEWARRE